MKRSRDALYQIRYYRKKTMDSLRKTIKELKEEKKLFMDSPEGIAYKKRKAREYYKVYREENREKNRKYQKEYYKLYGQI